VTFLAAEVLVSAKISKTLLAIARYLLPYTIFAALQDMGLPLPAYNEHIVRLEMSAAMREQYEELDGSHPADRLSNYSTILRTIPIPCAVSRISVTSCRETGKIRFPPDVYAMAQNYLR